MSDCDLILALDVPSRNEAGAILRELDNSLDWVKIGLQLFVKEGPSLVEEVAGMGYKVFLDLKLHDIPNTVASAIRSLEGIPASMLTLHGAGGAEMLAAAAQAQAESCPNLQLLAVTVLTSMDQQGLQGIGVDATPAEQVERLARLATANGVNGLVCSPQELAILRSVLPPETVLVTPGIRPAGSAVGDQKRIMTPVDAAQLGSSFIVVGRPILKATNPAEAAARIRQELRDA